MASIVKRRGRFCVVYLYTDAKRLDAILQVPAIKQRYAVFTAKYTLFSSANKCLRKRTEGRTI